jgi:hypothetical protein
LAEALSTPSMLGRACGIAYVGTVGRSRTSAGTMDSVDGHIDFLASLAHALGRA